MQVVTKIAEQLKLGFYWIFLSWLVHFFYWVVPSPFVGSQRSHTGESPWWCWNCCGNISHSSTSLGNRQSPWERHCDEEINSLVYHKILISVAAFSSLRKNFPMNAFCCHMKWKLLSVLSSALLPDHQLSQNLWEFSTSTTVAWNWPGSQKEDRSCI